jgi:hypothetical protein
MRALQQSATGDRPLGETSSLNRCDMALPISHGRPGSRTSRPGPATAPSQLASLVSESEPAPDRGRRTIRPPQETQTLEAVLQYYSPEHGLPTDMREPKGSGGPDWLEVRTSRKHTGGFEKTPETIADHNAKLDAAFYACREELGKPIDVVVREAERRLLEKRNGLAESERRGAMRTSLGLNQGPRKEHRYLSIQEANDLPTAAHTEPLLTMAFATLLDVVMAQHGGTTSRPTEFDVADPSLIDKDEAGYRTL